VIALLAAVAIQPHIVWKPIPFGAARRFETARYARMHYGIDSSVLRPKVIVEHYTANESFSATWSTFASDRPDPELGQLPGTCAHFVIDRDGTIYQLVRLNVMCRHTVGLNYVAIGIEHVGMSDAEILHNGAQLRASLALTRRLMARFHIALRNVIGHNESLSSPFHRERYAPWAHQTHGDWTHADMVTYRARLRSTR
jgi:beta-N-acetylhexosaminidase